MLSEPPAEQITTAAPPTIDAVIHQGLAAIVRVRVHELHTDAAVFSLFDSVCAILLGTTPEDESHVDTRFETCRLIIEVVNAGLYPEEIVHYIARVAEVFMSRITGMHFDPLRGANDDDDPGESDASRIARLTWLIDERLLSLVNGRIARTRVAHLRAHPLPIQEPELSPSELAKVNDGALQFFRESCANSGDHVVYERVAASAGIEPKGNHGLWGWRKGLIPRSSSISMAVWDVIEGRKPLLTREEYKRFKKKKKELRERRDNSTVLGHEV
jgi:hypothetical protein